MSLEKLICYYAVHTPVMGKPEKVAKYKKKLAQLGWHPKDEVAEKEGERWHHARQDNAEYAAMVESVDDNVGRLLKALDDMGIADNTVVIFTSDNGGLSTGKSKKAPTSSLPLRAGKAWIYEGGIREPLLVKWPGVTKPGAVVKAPVVSTDFYPTMLSAAGLPLRPKQHLDGKSLAPLLSGKQTSLDRKALYIHFPQDHHLSSTCHFACRVMTMLTLLTLLTMRRRAKLDMRPWTVVMSVVSERNGSSGFRVEDLYSYFKVTDHRRNFGIRLPEIGSCNLSDSIYFEVISKVTIWRIVE